MTRLFLDTNIVIDLLEKRAPFYPDAVRLFTMATNPCYLCHLCDPNLRRKTNQISAISACPQVLFYGKRADVNGNKPYTRFAHQPFLAKHGLRLQHP